MDTFAVKGNLIHAPVFGEIETKLGSLLEVDQDGNISSVISSDDPELVSRESYYRGKRNLLELSDNEFLLPGLVDTHVHAPQWPQLGKALHLPLHDWLQEYTFPLEARYADLGFANQVYSSLVETLIANGTTTALYFGTIHIEATKRLADICLNLGQRALIGKVVMDNPEQCPDYYRDRSTSVGLNETYELIDYVSSANGNASKRVLPVLTPRFIPSCTDEMLSGLGKIASETGCHIQTHCSESDWQHRYVIERHGCHDAQSLDSFGLLQPNTVLAHANFINDDDMVLISSKSSAVAHCPLSNFYFSNAVLPVRKLIDSAIDLGLGTDISGGFNPSIFNACAMAVTSSRALEEGVDAALPAHERRRRNMRIDFKEAFWMATTGGGRALDLKIGMLRPEYAMDAIVVDTSIEESNLKIWKDLDSSDDVLQKIIHNAHRTNITKVWVQGNQIK